MRTLLVTRTLKSKFIDGKYKDQLVSTIAKVDPNYIISGYFNFNKASFSNDVLDFVGIPEKFRIKKPGKSEDMCYKFYKERLSENLDKMTELEKIRFFKGRKKWRKTKAKLMMIRHENDDKKFFNRGALMSINHYNKGCGVQLGFRPLNGLENKKWPDPK